MIANFYGKKSAKEKKKKNAINIAIEENTTPTIITEEIESNTTGVRIEKGKGVLNVREVRTAKERDTDVTAIIKNTNTKEISIVDKGFT